MHVLTRHPSGHDDRVGQRPPQHHCRFRARAVGLRCLVSRPRVARLATPLLTLVVRCGSVLACTDEPTSPLTRAASRSWRSPTLPSTSRHVPTSGNAPIAARRCRALRRTPTSPPTPRCPISPQPRCCPPPRARSKARSHHTTHTPDSPADWLDEAVLQRLRLSQLRPRGCIEIGGCAQPLLAPFNRRV